MSKDINEMKLGELIDSLYTSAHHTPSCLRKGELNPGGSIVKDDEYYYERGRKLQLKADRAWKKFLIACGFSLACSVTALAMTIYSIVTK